MKPALILLCALLLAGCAEYDAYSTAFAKYTAAAADRKLVASEWEYCNTQSSGALLRRFAVDPGWLTDWAKVCKAISQKPTKLPETLTPPTQP